MFYQPKTNTVSETGHGPKVPGYDDLFANWHSCPDPRTLSDEEYVRFYCEHEMLPNNDDLCRMMVLHMMNVPFKPVANWLKIIHPFHTEQPELRGLSSSL